MRKIFVSMTVLCLAFTAGAQDKSVRGVLELGRTDNRTMEHADFLSNRIGGRPIGSHNLEDAEVWVAERFRSWGLEVTIQEVGQIGVGFSRGPWSGRLIGGDRPMQLHFVTPTYTAGTKGPQKGRVLIEPQSEREFENMKSALKGAWVLIGGNSDGFPISGSARADSVRNAIKARNAEVDRENAEIRVWNRNHGRSERREMKSYENHTALYYREMIEAGVLGFIQAANVPLQALCDRKGCHELTMETLPTVCDIKLDRNQYKEIEQMVLERRDFQLEFDIRNHFFKGPVKYHNVIGTIRGSRYPDEYVLLGGHLDAYDVASGSVDDANGVSVVMEAARMLAKSGAKPLRTMMFCIWTGEEYGLLGSKFFVENKTVPLEKISNYFNRDGGPLAATGIVVPPAMLKDFQKACEPLENYNPSIPFRVIERDGDSAPRAASARGSDHAPFMKKGVPVLALQEEDVFGRNFNYREIWHTERDLYYQLIPEYLEHSAVVYAVVSYGIANLPHLLSREGLYRED